MYHVIIICDNVVKIDDGIQRICVEERDKNMSGDTVLKAWMLGREDVTYGDKSILTGRNSMTKATKLLLILLHSGEDGVTRSQLMDELYGSEEMADVANNLRVTVHRLKKALAEAGLPPHDYIVSKNGGYKWSAPMKTEVDALEFRKLIQAADQENDEDKKAVMLEEACEMYQGEFLPRLSTEEWVLMESAQYKKLYTKALEWVCSYLKEHGAYEKILRIVDRACRLYPFDEWQAVKIDCYIELNRYEEAMKEYEDTAKLLSEELGVTPSEKMLKQFDIMSKRISSKPQLIGQIKEGLQEQTEEKGAFYCSMPSFRDAYRMMRRNMERSGQSVFLMLCTITDANGNCMMESDKLDQMSEALYQAVSSSLRRCDSFTKCNPAQFLIMLNGINEENCGIVEERITNSFSKEHKSWAKRLNCCVSSLYDAK